MKAAIVHDLNTKGLEDGLPPEVAWEPIRLSVIMPALNEGNTIEHALSRVLHRSYPCPIEVIVVDDGSTDATYAILSSVKHDNLVICRHHSNLGKGAAVLTGVAVATGTHMLIFDADLEYSPADISRLLRPIMD